MSMMFSGINKLLFVYLGDILIFSETEEEHVQHVRLVLRQLLKKSVFVKAERSDLHVAKVTVLRYIG